MTRVFGGKKRMQVIESDDEEDEMFDTAKDGDEGEDVGESDEDDEDDEDDAGEEKDEDEDDAGEKKDGDAAEKETDVLPKQIPGVTFGLIKAMDVHSPAKGKFKLLIVSIDTPYVPIGHLKRLVPRSRWVSKIGPYVRETAKLRVLDRDNDIDSLVRAVSGLHSGSELVDIRSCAIALKSIGETCISKPDNLEWVPEFREETPEAVSVALDSIERYAKYVEEEQRPKKRRKATAEAIAEPASAARIAERDAGAAVKPSGIAERAGAFIKKLRPDELDILKTLITAADYPLYLAVLKQQGYDSMEAAWIKIRIAQ